MKTAILHFSDGKNKPHCDTRDDDPGLPLVYLTDVLAQVTCEDCLNDLQAELLRLRRENEQLTEASRHNAIVVNGGTVTMHAGAKIGFLTLISGEIRFENGNPANLYDLTPYALQSDGLSRPAASAPTHPAPASRGPGG